LPSVSWDWFNGEAPLHYAALSGNADALRRLNAAGADLNAGCGQNAPSSACGSPLHAAVRAGRDEAAKVLLALGADPMVPDPRGETPIQAANALGMVALATEMKAAAPSKTNGGDASKRTTRPLSAGRQSVDRLSSSSSWTRLPLTTSSPKTDSGDLQRKERELKEALEVAEKIRR